MNNETLKQDPCENCVLRKGFAIAFDMHFWGEGCPYKCDEYDDWNRRAGEEGKHEAL